MRLAIGVAIVGIAVAVAIVRGLLAIFVEWADSEPEARKAHPFDERHPSHCDRCWKEASRRHALARRHERRASETAAWR